MNIPLNTPMINRIRDNIKDRLSQAGRPRNSDKSVARRDVKGKFYEFFKKHNLYDVDDSPFLTQDQIDRVPPIDRTYQSDLIDAIVDSLEWFLIGDFNDGVGPVIQTMIDKTLIKAMSADTKINTLSSAASAVPGLQPVKVVNDGIGSLISTSHGMFVFDRDVLPRYSFNLPSMNLNFSNLLPSGYLVPDWLFIKQQEITYNNFHFNGKNDSGLVIGVGIDLSNIAQDQLSEIFVVNSVDENGFPVGDPIMGITNDQYNVLKSVAIQTNGDKILGDEALNKLQNDVPIKTFYINELQALGSFVKYANITYWTPMNNPKEWMNAHWGSLCNNACPTGVRTAVMSYVYNHGPYLRTDSPAHTAFISYCLQMGVLYSIGHEFPISYTHLGHSTTDQIDEHLTTTIGGVKYTVRYGSLIGINGSTYYTNETQSIIIDSIPRNARIASLYFEMVAALISRRDYSSVLNDDDAKKMRNRRVKEANLIYSDILSSNDCIKYGQSVVSQPNVQQTQRLIDIYFDSLIKGVIFRYDNKQNPGTIDNGLESDDYSGYYAPNISFEFDNTLKNVRFWNSILSKDFLDNE